MHIILAIRFASSNKVIMQGITVQNNPKFHIILDECEDIHVEWLNIKSPTNSPNIDGIHMSKSNNVKIYHSTISTGN